MAVRAGISMSGEMLICRDDLIFCKPIGISRSKLCNPIGIVRERACSDDRICGVVMDVDIRGKIDIESQRL